MNLRPHEFEELLRPNGYRGKYVGDGLDCRWCPMPAANRIHQSTVNGQDIQAVDRRLLGEREEEVDE